MNPYPPNRPFEPFDEGGSLLPSVSVVKNKTGAPEHVLVSAPSPSGYLDRLWRATHKVEALTCDLLVELGYEPRTVSVANQEEDSDGQHILNIDDHGTVEIMVFELTDNGRKYLVWNDELGRKEAAHHVDTVTIDLVRVAKYRADLAAL